jgi:hypothetical protein
MTVQILLTLNLYRISYKACLYAGRLSINDNDDTEETSKAFGALLDRYAQYVSSSFAYAIFQPPPTIGLLEYARP